LESARHEGEGLGIAEGSTGKDKRERCTGARRLYDNHGPAYILGLPYYAALAEKDNAIFELILA